MHSQGIHSTSLGRRESVCNIV
uniref:Uncharacterized protein n=1 Tax=Anguilla anguilla TaxID=7936 RepID=A0A0E9V2Y5_ANGAN